MRVQQLGNLKRDCVLLQEDLTRVLFLPTDAQKQAIRSAKEQLQEAENYVRSRASLPLV